MTTSGRNKFDPLSRELTNIKTLESVDWYKFTSSSTFKLAIGFSSEEFLKLGSTPLYF